MQTRAILIAAALVLLFAASPTPVHAEILRTRRDTTLRARPGESQRAVARLQADQEVEVITRAGRWLRVRSGERVGWLTRTNVREQTPEQRAPRQTRAESWRRDQPEPAIRRERKKLITVRVTNGTQETFRAPSGTARVAFRARSTDLLTVVGDNQDRTWLLVENEHGHVGWLPAMITTQVAVTQATRDRRSALLATALADSTPAVDTPVALVSRHARAAIGYRVTATRFTSNGSAELANYRISAQAMTATLGGSLPLTASSSRFLASVEGEYRMSYSSPGIHYQDGAGQLDAVAFSMHEARAGGQLGVRLTDSALLAGRVGYHYGVFLVDTLDNRAGLANESLHGLTLGGRAHLAPGKRSSYAIRAGFDVLAGASRGQSAGLEDGAGSTASAWWGHLGMDYALTAGLVLNAHYAYERAGTEWTGQSSRQADVTEASRTDQSHLVYLGLGKSF
jgi:opacity protein-like surface antigen